jgi:hypothetical protein
MSSKNQKLQQLLLVNPGLGLLSGSKPITYSLRDVFTTARPATLNGTAATPGPSVTRTVTDTEKKIRAKDGALLITGGKASPSFSEPMLSWPATTRVAGKAYFGKIGCNGSLINYFSLLRSIAGPTGEAQFLSNAGYLFIAGYAKAGHITEALSSSETNRKLGIILRSSGAFFVTKGQSDTQWKLVAVTPFGSNATVIPSVECYNGTNYEVANTRLVTLPTPWNDDSTIATQILAGNRANGDTFTHEQHCLIQFTANIVSGYFDVIFRKQDSNNNWFVRINDDGSITIQERIAGTPNTRATAAAGSVANGNRVTIDVKDNFIHVIADEGSKTFYTSSSMSGNTSGSISIPFSSYPSDMYIWPKLLTGTKNDVLESAFNGQITPIWEDNFSVEGPITLVPGIAENSGHPRLLTDTEKKTSISGNKFIISGGKASPAWGDPKLRYSSSVTRGLGKILMGTLCLKDAFTNFSFGLGNAEDTFSNINGIYFLPGSVIRIDDNTTSSIDVGLYTDINYTYKCAIILRAGGAFYCIKGGPEYPDWTLLWPGYRNTTATLYPILASYDAPVDVSNVFLTSSVSPWNSSEYALATSYLPGLRTTASERFTHDTEFILEWKTGLPGVGCYMGFRYQDSNNYSRVYLAANGSLQLHDVIAGGQNIRGTAGAGTVSANSKITVLAYGSNIIVYVDGTERIVYATATNFKSNTTGIIINENMYTDVIAWPRTIKGAFNSALEAIK